MRQWTKNQTTELQKLRLEKNLTLRQALEIMQTVEPCAPKTVVGLKHIESRGTNKIQILRALSRVYDLPIEIIELAARRKVTR